MQSRHEYENIYQLCDKTLGQYDMSETGRYTLWSMM